MRNTDEGKQRLSEAEKRTNTALARQLEATEKKRKQDDEEEDQPEDARAKRNKIVDDVKVASQTTAHKRADYAEVQVREKRGVDQRDHDSDGDEEDENESPERHAKHRRLNLNKLTFYDDITNEKLSTLEVFKARNEEIQYFKEHRVYRKVPRDGKKVIGIKWIDVNKGDSKNPNVRSRLVAKEFWQKKENYLFAGTPPVESLRYLLSTVARSQKRNIGDMVNDVSRAYFHARTQRPIYVEIPSEDFDDGDEYNCAELDFSMYGTRDAAVD